MPKRDNIGREREKKILVTNSVRTQPGQENFKNNSKKIQKIKKVNSDIISIQNELGEGKKKGKKNLFLNSVHTGPVQGNSEKKKLKNSRN